MCLVPAYSGRMLSGSQSAHFLRFASSTTRVGLGLDWPMPGRRFPPPWTVEEYRGISYIVRHVNNFPVAYTYLELEFGTTRTPKGSSTSRSGAPQ